MWCFLLKSHQLFKRTHFKREIPLSNMEGLKPGTKGSLGEEGDKEGGKGDLNKGDEGEEEEERLDKSW